MTTRNSIARILDPKSVVVVGASADESKLGGRCLKWLRAYRYSGQVSCVNPNRSSIQDFACYPSLEQVPAGVDVVLLAVRREEVPALLPEAGKKGAAACINFASGYGESGEHGAELERELVATARHAGVRVIGPNCFGVANFHSGTMMTPAAALGMPGFRRGGLSMVGQSGGITLGSALAMANREGIGLGKIVSVGNEADLEAADFLEYLIDDHETTSIALVIEGFKSPERYGSLFDRARRARKPVVVLSLGASPKGQRMAQLHTGHLAGSHRVRAAFLRQHGVFTVADVDELVRDAAQFGFWERTRAQHSGGRLAVVSISGGQATLAADLAHSHGVALSELSAKTAEDARKLLPPYANVANPLDIGAYAMGDPTLIGRLVRKVQEDPAVDIVLAVLIVARTYEPEVRDLIQAIHASTKPVLICWPGEEVEGNSARLLADAGIPCYRTLQAAIKSIANYCKVDRNVQVTSDPAAIPASSIPALPETSEPFLDEWECKQLLSACRVAVPRAGRADSADSAVAAAGAIGYPVVLKAVSPDVVHKAKHGLVALHLEGEAQVREACRKIQASFARLANREAGHPRWSGFLVEEHIEAEHEFIVGLKWDSQFGLALIVGAGGSTVELKDDVALRVLPVQRGDIVGMLEELRSWRALDPLRRQRFSGPMIEAVDRVAAAGARWGGRLEALDINPLMVSDKAAVAVDAVIQNRKQQVTESL